MTALTAFKYESQEQKITVTKEAIQKEENFGQLKAGEELTAKDLLSIMLIESSNDAAVALASALEEKNFLGLMNLQASQLGLSKTSFVDVAGVDPNREGEEINVSSAEDLAKLAMFIQRNYPEIFETLQIPQLDLYAANGRFHHTLKNTNELLRSNGWPTKVLGGKTGWTPLAKGNLILLLESPEGDGYLVNVVLGSDDRFGEMKTLVDWIFRSYDF